MSKAFTAILLLALSAGANAACQLTWQYDPEAATWLDGFRIYQDGTVTGTAPRDATEIDCIAAGLNPLGGPITMTAHRGPDESPQSDPAVFDLRVVGTIRVVIGLGQ